MARYVNQVKTEKRMARASRLDNEEAFALVSKGKGRYSSIPGEQNRGITDSAYHFPDYSGQEFDPYDTNPESTNKVQQSFAYDGTALPVEVGYGGGLWTYHEISEEEKARLKTGDGEMIMPELAVTDDEEYKKQKISGPALVLKTKELDDLPRYTLSDPPQGSGMGH